MLNLIPIPYKSEIKNSSFIIDENLKTCSDFELPLLSLDRADDGKLIIKKDSSLSGEGYTLDVKEDCITITSASEVGAYYALQSLRQISQYELGKREVPCCTITDKPNFKWRGMHLDESRHFFGKDEVKRLLDLMFMMKLNVFHWHLTDDQGWRVEIKKYPCLTEIGSVRKYTQVNGWHSIDTVDEVYGGFYTQEDIKEIVAYASQRGITVIPEIDFPAHSAAAIAAYPWLACRELEREVPGYFGSVVPVRKFGIRDWNRTICVGKEKTIQFVLDVIDEVCELFPAKYFHIGGDEAPKNEWKKCPHCQKVIKDNHLKNEEDLQGWFNNRVLEHLKTKGKRLIGWNEILKAGNLDKTVIAQYWTPQRDRNAEHHANSGGSIIMSNHQSFYFDMPYGKYPLKNTYDYSPVKFGVNEKNIKNVLGVEGEVWTEWIDGREKLDLQIFPRMQALAEVAWSQPENKDWQDFKARLDNFKDYYKRFGINYAVDSVSMPKNIFKRGHIEQKFMKGDTHLEVKLNKKYKDKGER
ncbi:MAG: beta-N-acetylhexosaminidase [Eubacterium sp.]|nr:beta-N-acetylhexosaminidase [Eubacterium sp.]